MAEIVVLDDVLDAVVLVEKILSRKGHSVHSFTDEEEAIAYVKNNVVDLAILDIKLKKMSGVEVLGYMKEINPVIKVIMLTGYPTIETAQESIELGAGEYCVKPIDKKELEDKVSDVLGR
jgi:DNA-binding NtrC family response regulator